MNFLNLWSTNRQPSLALLNITRNIIRVQTICHYTSNYSGYRTIEKGDPQIPRDHKTLRSTLIPTHQIIYSQKHITFQEPHKNFDLRRDLAFPYMLQKWTKIISNHMRVDRFDSEHIAFLPFLDDHIWVRMIIKILSFHTYIF